MKRADMLNDPGLLIVRLFYQEAVVGNPGGVGPLRLGAKRSGGLRDEEDEDDRLEMHRVAISSNSPNLSRP
jgi:hypothetical protein